jgi:hypothetical protein
MFLLFRLGSLNLRFRLFSGCFRRGVPLTFQFLCGCKPFACRRFRSSMPLTFQFLGCCKTFNFCHRMLLLFRLGSLNLRFRLLSGCFRRGVPLTFFFCGGFRCGCKCFRHGLPLTFCFRPLMCRTPLTFFFCGGFRCGCGCK